MKRTLPTIITAVITILITLDFFIGLKPLQESAGVLRSWGIVIAAFAMGLGAVSLYRTHLRAIVRHDKDAFFSILLVGSMTFMIVLGVGWGTSNKIYSFLFTNVLSAASGTLYASIAFYIVSAAYRSFAARNLDGWILVITAIIVMLGNAPVGRVIWSFFPTASTWIQNVPNTAGMRTIMIGAALGVVSTAVKTVLGLEKSYLGQGE